MRLARVETIPYALPFGERYSTATGELDRRESVLVRIYTDDGIVGLGETVPMSLRGGAPLELVVAELADGCGPVLTGCDVSSFASGDARAIRELIWDLLGRCRARQVGLQPICAIDIALHDLAGRLSGLPVWRLLGVPSVREISCNATLDGGAVESVSRRAATLVDRGFTTFKVKVGTGADVERVTAVRDVVGDAARIRLDANGAWDVAEATSMLGDLARCGIELIEQPGPDLETLAAVRALTPIPVVADESIVTEADAHRARALVACDAATVKLAKVGGILEALRIAAVIPTYLSSALDGPVGIAAAIHTAQALPSAGYAGGLAHGLATADLFTAELSTSPQLYGPWVLPRPAPGLGLEIDESMLDRLRIR